MGTLKSEPEPDWSLQFWLFVFFFTFTLAFSYRDTSDYYGSATAGIVTVWWSCGLVEADVRQVCIHLSQFATDESSHGLLGHRMFLQTDDKLVVISALAVICATTWTLAASNLTRRADMQQVDAGHQDAVSASTSFLLLLHKSLLCFPACSIIHWFQFLSVWRDSIKNTCSLLWAWEIAEYRPVRILFFIVALLVLQCYLGKRTKSDGWR